MSWRRSSFLRLLGLISRKPRARVHLYSLGYYLYRRIMRTVIAGRIRIRSEP